MDEKAAESDGTTALGSLVSLGLRKWDDLESIDLDLFSPFSRGFQPLCQNRVGSIRKSRIMAVGKE